MRTFLVALQYPNGRIHETVYETEQTMERATEFAMHEHTWRVVGLLQKKHRADLPPARRTGWVQRGALIAAA